MTTLFISDLHLSPERPEIGSLFGELLRNEARDADALYILGDLFEFWIGDDAGAILGYGEVVSDIKGLSDTGVPVHFIRGNRDFLVGERFAEESGCRILPDPTVIQLYGQPVLLTHGDYLCTDDIEHQKFRATVDDPSWRADFLSKPIEYRTEMAHSARKQSRDHKLSISMDIMDVNPDAVERTFERYGVDLMIHGHTHRPAVHSTEGSGGERRRIVLGDWYTQSSVLRCRQGAQVLDPDPAQA